MSAIINGSSPSVTFSDGTTQSTSAIVGGKLPSSALPTGTVVQVQSYSLTTTFSSSTASMVDTGLTVNITPSSSSNKILVLVNLSTGVAGNGYEVGMNIVRNGTNIAQGTGGTTNITQSVGNTGNSSHANSMSMNYLDSPATTSACTYKVQMQPQSGTTVYLNRTAALNSTNDVYAYGYISTITVMEISA